MVKEETVVNVVPKLYKLLNNKYKDLKFKTERELGIIYNDYLKELELRHSHIKTLLYKNTPKNLYSFFEPMDLIQDQSNIINSSDTNNITRISNKLCITGSGGMGKSMLMKHILLDNIKKNIYIPVFIELKILNQLDDVSLEHIIFKSLDTLNLNLTYDQFLYTLSSGDYLILLDGLDEVDPQKLAVTELAIQTFSSKYNKNKYIISSRPADIFIGWNEFHELKLSKLTKKQALTLVEKLEYEKGTKNKFKQALRQRLYDQHESFASTPLLLTIMLITFIDGGEIPDNLVAFYEQAYNALFYQHDASKSGFSRNMKTKNILDIEKFKNILSYIAFKSFFSSKINISSSELHDYLKKFKNMEDLSFNDTDFISDSERAVCMIIKDGQDYKFVHRSFQEYFAALYLENLNDSIQKKIFKAWLDDDIRVIRSNNNFINTLIYRQQQRLFENLYFPIIEDFNQTYKNELNNNFEDGYKIWFDSILNSNKSIRFTSSNKFTHILDVFFQIVRLKNIPLIDIYDENHEVLKKKLLIEFEAVYDDQRINIQQLLKEDNPLRQYVLDWLNSWCINMFKFIETWKSKYELQHNTNKRTLDNLIGDL